MIVNDLTTAANNRAAQRAREGVVNISRHDQLKLYYRMIGWTLIGFHTNTENGAEIITVQRPTPIPRVQRPTP